MILIFDISVAASADSENRIPNSINSIPVASALFEDTDNSTYDLSSSTSAPTRINGLTSRVNGSSALPNTSPNESKYTYFHLSYLYRFTFAGD